MMDIMLLVVSDVQVQVAEGRRSETRLVHNQTSSSREPMFD
jgi:hypothetical protein